MSLFFVDVEAWGDCPAIGQMTEFGVVEGRTEQSFHGIIIQSSPDPANPAVPLRTGKPTLEHERQIALELSGWLHFFKPPFKMVSDNPAYDFMWIADLFGRTLGEGTNPFGHSARRIGDYYAGLMKDFYARQDWKRLRITKHDHHPVHDALGNVEAFNRLQMGER